MRFEGDRTTRVPVLARRVGIVTFRVEGVVDGERVEGRWDGEWLCATSLLYERSALVAAVEEIFGEPNAPGDQAWTAGRSPEGIMLTLVTSCDVIDVAEYELNGRRRVISI